MSEKIPFNVELWKSGKYDVVTKNGKAVVSVQVHDVDIKQPVSFIVENSNEIDCCTKNGRYLDKNKECGLDLFLISKKRKVWIAIDPFINEDNQHSTTGAMLSREPLELSHTVKDWHIVEVELPQ